MVQPEAPQARLILNGKSAQIPDVRDAVQAMRDQGHSLDVRVTWEAGDALRLVHEAAEAGVSRLVAGGGDGTVNEVVAGLMALEAPRRPMLGILPLGSANDFANGLGLPLEPEPALSLALTSRCHGVDVARLGEDCFINMATGGFGAEVTTSTPLALKRLLGGGAYSLMGMLKAWHYQPYRGRLEWADESLETPLFLLAIGNGRQAGGGQCLAPGAKLDDGLLDVLVVRHFASLSEMRQLLQEIEQLPRDGEFVRTIRTPGLTFTSRDAFPLNLDGEPRHLRRFEVTLEPRAVKLAMPDGSDLLAGSG
ncbi:lipid kinase YegS [Modicisalibacter tunisiensis]|uniref:Probable lipid kinase YegS-like n=1 Tax=Modicisalibacter tunisiensis TaxID=390637 RepID=A0ABS7X3N0_9GAMM|nr:lipid kinase YegS [Modicisalibacter tunisiensis]MBZ9537509.1 lipid kinase YegS [Modicisalibacter tunisiensis]MBZ9569069.1 lipid kinase YegS [Modicisalibacter tunisiensis]